MELKGSELRALREALLGSDSAEFIAFIVNLVLGRDVETIRGDIPELATRLGLTKPGSLNLTTRGQLVGDSLREYGFWVDRHRRLPAEAIVPHLSAAYFAGKSTVEIGCGAGCNLWSLSRTSQELAGVEPEPLYPQIGRILCEREGLEPPKILAGSAEALPFADGQFDVALCISSHQYMDLTAGLKEIVRILRPGGELLLVGGTLDTYLEVGSRALRRNARELKPFLMTIANTLAYQIAGRRLIHRKGRATTAYPIYPSAHYMKRRLAELGLHPSRDISIIYPETCFSFRKA